MSISSAEAEYSSITATVAKIIWLQGLLKKNGIEFKIPVEVYSDSKAAMQIAANPIYHERTKHIEIECFYKRENYSRSGNN